MDKPVKLFTREEYMRNDLHLFVSRFEEGFTNPYHSHDFIEYCYIAQGKGFHHIENDIFPVHKGLFYAIPIGVSHVFRPSSPSSEAEPLIVYNCLFDEHTVGQIAHGLHEQAIREHLEEFAAGRLPYITLNDRSGAIEDIMLNLYSEMSVERLGSRTMLHALLSQLIVTVFRQKFGISDKPTTTASQFGLVLSYLEQHLSENITLANLVANSSWSSRHLQRLFLQHTGQSFGSYLLNLRIQRSCELLRFSQHKVSTIAEMVGYRDIDSFNAMFKKIVGQTPTEYRRSQG